MKDPCKYVGNSVKLHLSMCSVSFRYLQMISLLLLKVTDSWPLNTDHGLINAVVFLKESLQHQDHNVVLSKLHVYGIQGQ